MPESLAYGENGFDKNICLEDIIYIPDDNAIGLS